MGQVNDSVYRAFNLFTQLKGVLYLDSSCDSDRMLHENLGVTTRVLVKFCDGS